MSALQNLAVLCGAALLAGCASVSPDGLRGDVAALTAGRTSVVPQAALPATDPQARAQAQQSIESWLAQPLTQDAAVRIALLNNPGLQARLAALGAVRPVYRRRRTHPDEDQHRPGPVEDRRGL